MREQTTRVRTFPDVAGMPRSFSAPMRPVRIATFVAFAALALAGCKDPPAPPALASSASASVSVPSLTASASAPVPPAPIDGALPGDAPHALDRRVECAKESCPLAHLVPDEVRPTLSDGAPMVVWEEAIAERASLTFPRDEPVELMGVVLDGSLDLTAMEAAPQSTTVGGRWTAFRAPGGGVTLNGTGGKAVRVALVVAVSDPGVSLGAHLEQRDRPGAPPAWSWNVRKKRIETVAFADRADLAWAGGSSHARIGWEGGDHPAAVIDLLRFSAGAGVAEHDHAHAWETLAVLEGDGTLVRRPASGEQRVEIRPGALVTIPAGVRHAFLPSGKAPFFAIQVYAPPGPEQRFKKLASPGP
jgi:mannose-6-phosphate isomerase-like protein (cupin superfamily)